MKFPLSWLKEFIHTRLSPDKIAETLTQLGLEAAPLQTGGPGLTDEDAEFSPQPTDAETGADKADFLRDMILELSLTPNLSHCSSIRGIARELSAATQEPVITPAIRLQENPEVQIHGTISVEVASKEECPLYACRLLSGIRVGPSPSWLKRRVEACGMRSVNNVVDAANYAMLERGQPVHAFDHDKIDKHRLSVRFARNEEKITGIDGEVYYPGEQTLVICDGKGPVAIAGIMGSAESGVQDSTHAVLLEAAYFEPKQVRRSCRRLGISTEASRRFERGIDPNAVLEGLDRASELIVHAAGGMAASGVIEKRVCDFPPREILCRLARINQLLGIQLGMSEVETIFKRLEMKIKEAGSQKIKVLVPTYRHDIKEEIDLVEEAARLYGYHHIPRSPRIKFEAGALKHSSIYLFEKRIRRLLAGLGLQELITSDLISLPQAQWLSPQAVPHRTLITLLNPQSQDQSILRPSLLPGLLEAVRFNIAHSLRTVCGFEIGRLHFKIKEAYMEPTAAALVLTGNRSPGSWSVLQEPFDFFDLKGILSSAFEALKIQITFEASSSPDFHPGRQASLILEGHEIGTMGEVYPEVLKKAGVSQPVFYAEMHLEDLQKALPSHIKMSPLPHYPSIQLDWNVLLHKDCPVGEVFSSISKQGSLLLDSFSLLDLYQSEQLGKEWLRATFHFVYRSNEKTVSLEEVRQEHGRITDQVLQSLKTKKLGKL